MNKSFTLVEMIVVIAIIAVLAAIVAPSAFRAIEKAKLAKVTQDSKSIKSAAYAMYADTGLWPGSNWSDDAATDVLAGADKGEGFVFQGDDSDMPATWDGPYIEKWDVNHWGGWYWWDYNHGDQNGDGIGREHVLWIDNQRDNSGKRIPQGSRLKLDDMLDDGDLSTGRVQVWQTTNLGFILIHIRLKKYCTRFIIFLSENFVTILNPRLRPSLLALSKSSCIASISFLLVSTRSLLASSSSSITIFVALASRDTAKTCTVIVIASSPKARKNVS